MADRDHAAGRPATGRSRRRPSRPSRSTRCRCARTGSVLDGLNYIKDQLDGTLSYRWSCRMGICGSCGMTVNGEPKLTCATFLTDYAPGPVRVEPLRNFPVIRDLVVEIGDFMRKLADGQAVDRPREEEPLAEGEYLQTPDRAGRVQAVQHVHQLHAVLRRLPGVRPGPEVPRPGGDRAGAALQPRLPRPGRPTSGWTSSRRTRASGAARSWASAPGSARSTSTRPGPSSGTS